MNVTSALSNAREEEAKMSTVGNIGFPSHLRASLHINGASNQQKKKNSCSFMAQNAPIRLNNGITCKLPDSGIDESPTSKRISNSKNRMAEYNIAMKNMMRNPYEYHHDLG